MNEIISKQELIEYFRSFSDIFVSHDESLSHSKIDNFIKLLNDQEIIDTEDVTSELKTFSQDLFRRDIICIYKIMTLNLITDDWFYLIKTKKYPFFELQNGDYDYNPNDDPFDDLSNFIEKLHHQQDMLDIELLKEYELKQKFLSRCSYSVLYQENEIYDNLIKIFTLLKSFLILKEVDDYYVNWCDEFPRYEHVDYFTIKNKDNTVNINFESSDELEAMGSRVWHYLFIFLSKNEVDINFNLEDSNYDNSEWQDPYNYHEGSENLPEIIETLEFIIKNNEDFEFIKNSHLEIGNTDLN